MFTVKFEDAYGNWRLVEADEVRVTHDVPEAQGDPAVVLVDGGHVGKDVTVITHHDSGRVWPEGICVSARAIIENEQGKTTQIVRPKRGIADAGEAA